MLILLFSMYSSFKREIYLGLMFANKCDMWTDIEPNFVHGQACLIPLTYLHFMAN